MWETLANDALKAGGFEGVKTDRRTLEDQGIDRIPQTHIGSGAQEIADSAEKEDEESSSQGEGEQDGETGKKGSGGGGGQASAGANEDEGEEDKSGDGGSCDPVALKLQSKPKLDDDKKRIIIFSIIRFMKDRLTPN